MAVMVVMDIKDMDMDMDISTMDMDIITADSVLITSANKWNQFPYKYCTMSIYKGFN
jgi:hypothetical protein